MDAGSSSFPGRYKRSGYNALPLKCGSRTGLPLVPCPTCGAEILELAAGAGSQVPGAIFFKCRFHDKDDSSSCPWIMFADKYERFLIKEGLIGGNKLQIVPALSSEGAGLEGAADSSGSAVPILGQIGGLDAKLKVLVILGQIGVGCTVVIGIFVVIGVIFLLLNRK